MRHPAGRRPPQRAMTIRAVVARMALLLVGAACTGPRPASNLTPTLIPQPTPDRTVDAVVRGRVTLGLTGTPGTPGTPDPRATAAVGSSGHSAVPTAVHIVTAVVPTVSVATGAHGVTVVPVPTVVTRSPTVATGRAVPTEPVPLVTRAATSAPARPTAVPTAPPRQSAPTAAAPPTFGRAPGASGLVRP
jgi:hypothetical protein